ncbi:MAG: hypothetical protein ABSA85_13365 [Terracidiphilus sp.]|jgi:hypothetical protein
MKAARLATLKIFALIFLLLGLAGLIASAATSTYYLEVMPGKPTPEELRVVPRDIHGMTVYQKVWEDRLLTELEYSSVGVFLVGVVLSAVYLEKWGTMRAGTSEEEDAELVEDLH